MLDATTELNKVEVEVLQVGMLKAPPLIPQTL